MSVLQRQRYLLDFTLSSLLRRKGKHLALVTVYTLIIFMLASVMLFAHALKKEIGDALSASPEIVLQRIEAGRHALDWDGRDDDGSRLASGVYFLRLDAAGGAALSRKLVLLK